MLIALTTRAQRWRRGRKLRFKRRRLDDSQLSACICGALCRRWRTRCCKFILDLWERLDCGMSHEGRGSAMAEFITFSDSIWGSPESIQGRTTGRCLQSARPTIFNTRHVCARAGLWINCRSEISACLKKHPAFLDYVPSIKIRTV